MRGIGPGWPTSRTGALQGSCILAKQFQQGDGGEGVKWSGRGQLGGASLPLPPRPRPPWRRYGMLCVMIAAAFWGELAAAVWPACQPAAAVHWQADGGRCSAKHPAHLGVLTGMLDMTCPATQAIHSSASTFTPLQTSSPAPWSCKCPPPTPPVRWAPNSCRARSLLAPFGLRLPAA